MNDAIKLSVVHPKDHGASNPRIQCPKCGKWKRHMSIHDGRAVYNHYNLSDEDCERMGYQELCARCYNQLLTPHSSGIA